MLTPFLQKGSKRQPGVRDKHPPFEISTERKIQRLKGFEYFILCRFKTLVMLVPKYGRAIVNIDYSHCVRDLSRVKLLICWKNKYFDKVLCDV